MIKAIYVLVKYCHPHAVRILTNKEVHASVKKTCYNRDSKVK